MNIFDKVRIKWKIKKICKVLKQLSQADQAECVDKIVYCLKVTNDWKMKEHFLDMIAERFSAICQ